MRWDKVFSDAYYYARQHEYTAKRQERFGHIADACRSWLHYSKIKENKGSYFLALKGYVNARRLNTLLDQPSNDDIEQRIKALKRPSYEELLHHYDAARDKEIKGDPRGAMALYTKIAELHIDSNNYFLAADAYEHVAEIRYDMGMDVMGFSRSLEMWDCNAHYWEKEGELDDATWSKERADFFSKLYRS